MAQLVGDGPNRGKSAPPPRRLPKPEKDRPRTVADALAGVSTGVGISNRPLMKLPSFERRGLGDTQWKPHMPLRGPLVAEAAKAEGTRKNQSSATAEMYDNMAKRQQKDDKRLQREARDRSETEEALTAEEWVKLSPTQQAAAQVNADLMAAVAKDFRDQGKHTANSSQKEGGTERVQKYMAKVEDLFGEDGSVGFKGLEFAPNTLAFLESRGLDKDELKGKTLDDFVSGDALIDDKDFEALADDKARGGSVDFARTLAQGQLRYQEQLASQLKRGDQLLTDITGRDTNARAGNEYGAKALPDRTKLTAVRPEMVGQIDKYMEILARTDIPLDESINSIKLDLSEASVSKQEASQIWENMIERTRAASTGDAQWFDDVDFQMRSPLDVAKVLGATTLKREGAK